MDSFATLRRSVLSLGFAAAVLLGATPTDRSEPPSRPSAEVPPSALPSSPPVFAAPLVNSQPARQHPGLSGRQSVVELSEAEVVQALKIMKRLDDHVLEGTLMEHPVTVAPSTATAVDNDIDNDIDGDIDGDIDDVELLREIASRVDAMANRLEVADLYPAADQLRREADDLRLLARRLRTAGVRQGQSEPGGQPAAISRRRILRVRHR